MARQERPLAESLIGGRRGKTDECALAAMRREMGQLMGYMRERGYDALCVTSRSVKTYLSHTHTVRVLSVCTLRHKGGTVGITSHYKKQVFDPKHGQLASLMISKSGRWQRPSTLENLKRPCFFCQNLYPYPLLTTCPLDLIESARVSDITSSSWHTVFHEPTLFMFGCVVPASSILYRTPWINRTTSHPS